LTCGIAESKSAVNETHTDADEIEVPMNTPTYSSIFACLYDEPTPVGHLGRGTHYSVFRSVEWLDVVRTPLRLPQIHDFAVVWDEDHDTRIIQVLEDIYMAGLLSPIQFIGERKGTLTAIVAAKFYYSDTEASLDAYTRKLNDISANTTNRDSWPVEIGMFDRSPGSPHQTDVKGLISADEYRVITYLRNIDSLWSLGTKQYVSQSSAPDLGPPPPIPPLPVPQLPR
jgi:hypothetical protein